MPPMPTNKPFGEDAMAIPQVPASEVKKDALSKPSDKPAPVAIPEMPESIRNLIHEKYNYFDEQGEELVAAVKDEPACMEFGHARETFYSHLVGTFGLLCAWGQPSVVRRTGLFHTAYSGDLFQFYIFKADCEVDREKVRGILGEEAEALTWLFGTIGRGDLCRFGDVVSREIAEAVPLEAPTNVKHRFKGTHEMSIKDTANILMVTIADYMEQMVDMNGWKDHHQIDTPDGLYPGDGRPAVAFYWMTTVAKAIAPHLDVIPQFFDNCTTLITYKDELKARDLYWQVIINEKTLEDDKQMELLRECVSLNPIVGEPHVMMAQLHHRQGNFHQGAEEAATALKKMYILATAWDKRRSFPSWVGFTRVFLMRCQRGANGQDQFPRCPKAPPSALGLKLVNLNDALEEMGTKAV